MAMLPTHGAARVTRGLVAAAVCTFLSLLGHAGAGGALPDAGLLVVLGLPLAALLVALADRRRGPVAILAVVGGSQLALHGLLQVLGPHAHGGAGDGAVDPLAMFGAHTIATLVTAAVLAGAESAVFLVAAALAWALNRVPPAPVPVPAVGAPPAVRFGPVEPWDARPREALGRRLCPRRGPPMTGSTASAH